jgi:hypothetical protein
MPLSANASRKAKAGVSLLGSNNVPAPSAMINCGGPDNSIADSNGLFIINVSIDFTDEGYINPAFFTIFKYF